MQPNSLAMSLIGFVFDTAINDAVRGSCMRVAVLLRFARTCRVTLQKVL